MNNVKIRCQFCGWNGNKSELMPLLPEDYHENCPKCLSKNWVKILPAVNIPVEIYFRPFEAPCIIKEDEDVRLNYCGKWIDFKGGMVIVSDGDSGKFIGEI